MKIGLDLDRTVFGFPAFFKAFIDAMTAAGHEIIITGNGSKRDWRRKNAPKFRLIGIDPDKVNATHLSEKREYKSRGGPANKARMAALCDVVFDDDAACFQELTTTPVFTVPKHKGIDKDAAKWAAHIDRVYRQTEAPVVSESSSYSISTSSVEPEEWLDHAAKRVKGRS